MALVEVKWTMAKAMAAHKNHHLLRAVGSQLENTWRAATKKPVEAKRYSRVCALNGAGDRCSRS